MKVGLSFSRCTRDIADGRVDIRDVLVIIARTDVDPNNDEQWKIIWQGYGGGHRLGSALNNPEWMNYANEDESRVRDVVLQLWNEGKLHQPRKFGAYPPRLPYHWLEVSLPSEELEGNPAVKLAWERFQIVAGLCSPNKILKDDF